MKMPYVVSIIVVAFVMGFFAGVRTLKQYNQELEECLNTVPAEDKIDVTLRALSLTRQNNTNTIPYLEAELDVSVDDLGHALQKIPQSKWDSNASMALNHARAYRKNFPWKSEEPNLDSGVSNAFSLLNPKTTP